MKKKVNILLLLVVVGLWGTVIYRYTHRFLFQSNDYLPQAITVNSNINRIVAKDSFELPIITRDPFLNKTTVTKTISKNHYIPRKRTIASTTTIAKQTTITALPKPNIKYYGYIKSQGAISELFLIKVNGKLLKLKLNQEAENLKITQVKNDSVKIVYNKKETLWVVNR